jgi:para-nitrobenzyl esterase
MIGTTGADIPGWYNGRAQSGPYDAFGELAHEGRELYESRELMSRERLASVVAADMNMHEPARFLARRMTARGARAWLFRFDYVAESQRALHRHAPHASELAFLFDQLDARLGRNTTPLDRSVAASLHGYVVNFVRSGDPNTAGLSSWPAFDPARYDLMMFARDGQAVVQPDVLRERIALIEAVRE